MTAFVPAKSSSTRRSNVGVIGLGHCWQRRYRAALRDLSDRFQVQAVCDQVPQRAEQIARQLECAPAAGPTELLENDRVEALLLLDVQWYRLWPIELACRLGKPVFCAVPLESDAHGESLPQQVRASGLPVMTALAPRLAPATVRLRELLSGPLGPARLLVCNLTGPLRPSRAPSEATPPTSLFGPMGEAVLDWCLGLIDGSPLSVLATTNEAAGLVSMVLELAGGRAIQLLWRRGAGLARGLRLQVSAENGQASLELPGRVRWTAADGRHLHDLPVSRTLTQVLLERFHQTVSEGRPPEPSLEDSSRALACLRAAIRSSTEGRRIELTPATG